MRFIPIILLFLMTFGCSSGSNPTSNALQTDDARITMGEPYSDGEFTYVDLSISGAPKLYQFSMRFEFDPECLELDSFEPSNAFGSSPVVFAERINSIPDELLSDMANPSNALYAVAVSRPDTSDGDIENPNQIGRLRFRKKCDSQFENPRIFENEDFLVFRDRERNRFRVRTTNPETHEGRGGGS